MKIIFITIYIFTLTIAFAQSDLVDLIPQEKIKIDSIRITGNSTTKDYIILRELNFKIGDSITPKQINFNKERVFSLGLFSKVEINVFRENNFNIANVHVEESWYIYPLPFLKLRDDRISRASYGIILLYKNFRGRNETLTGYATFGYDPSYMLSYYNPVLITGKKLTFGFGFGYTDIQNRNIVSKQLNGKSFSYNYIFGRISIGYRLNLYNNIQQTTAYEYIDVPQAVAPLTSSSSSIDRILSSTLSYEFDNRDLKQFSSNGTLGYIALIHKGFGLNGISYNILNMDLRHYKLVVGNLSAKVRGLFRHTFGKKVPFYALSLLGDSEYVRGHKFNRREGNNYILSSFEVNYPLVKEWNLRFDLPLLPTSLTSARIGLYLNGFFDTGTTYYNNESLKIKEFDSGWGFGITLLILPYNAIRFEYAFNEKREGEFIIESGFSF